MTGVLSKAITEDLRMAAAYGLRNKPKQPKRLLVKGLRFLKSYVVASVMLASPAPTAWNAVAGGALQDTGITNTINMKADNLKAASLSGINGRYAAGTVMGASTCVVENVGDYLKNGGENLQLDLSNVTFTKEDLARMKDKESDKAKEISKIAERTTSANGYCARHAKAVMNKSGLLDHLPQERKQDILWGLASAYQFQQCFDNGEVKDCIEISLDDEAAKQTKMQMPMWRVNETAPGAEHAHIQWMDLKGGFFGQVNPSCPFGHYDEAGRFHQYGEAHFYALKEDIKTLITEVPGLVAVADIEKRTLTVFRENEIPQQYQTLVAEFKQMKNSAAEMLAQAIPADALRVEKPILRVELEKPAAGNDKTLLAQADIKKELPNTQRQANNVQSAVMRRVQRAKSM